MTRRCSHRPEESRLRPELVGVSFMHPVHASQKCRFSAAGGTDDCSDFSFRNLDVDTLQGFGFVEECFETSDFQFGLSA